MFLLCGACKLILSTTDQILMPRIDHQCGSDTFLGIYFTFMSKLRQSLVATFMLLFFYSFLSQDF